MKRGKHLEPQRDNYMAHPLLKIHIVVLSLMLTVVIGWDRVGRENLSFQLELLNELNFKDNEHFQNITFSVNKLNREIGIYSYNAKAVFFIKDIFLSSKPYESAKLINSLNFENPTDIKFDFEGNIWIADPTLETISIISPKSGLLRIDQYRGNGVSKFTISKNFYVLKFADYSEEKGLMRVINQGNNEEIYFGRLPTEYLRSGLLYDYTLASDDNSIYTGNLNSGLITKYDTKGRLMYSISTVEAINSVQVDSQVVEGKFGLLDGSFRFVANRINKESRRAIVDMDINEGLLFILFDGNKNMGGNFIDIYDKNTGNYVASIEPPKRGDEVYREIEILDSHIFLHSSDKNSNNYIREYKLHEI